MAGRGCKPAFNAGGGFHEDLHLAFKSPRPLKMKPSTSAHPLSEICSFPPLGRPGKPEGEGPFRGGGGYWPPPSS